VKRLSLLLSLAAACGGAQQAPGPRNFPGDEKKVVREDPTVAGDPWKGREDLIKAPRATVPVPLPIPPITRFTLANGLKVLVVPSKDLPVVSFGLSVPAGAADESRGKRGLAEFAAQMLTRGTRRLSADRIAQTIDFVGGQLGAVSGLEATNVTCAVLAKDASTCLALLGEVLSAPTFPAAEMRTVADQLLTGVRQQRDQPEALGAAHFENALWGDDRPRGWPLTESTIAAIQQKDLVAWHRARFVPNASLLVVAGDVDPDAIKAQLGKALAGWKRGKVPATAAWTEPKLDGITIRLVDKPDLTQSHIVVGHLGIAHADPMYFPATLANHVLGGGLLTSRLERAIRIKGGKTYGVRSGFQQTRVRGAFRIGTTTRTEETGATLDSILVELAKMQAEGPTEDELVDARAAIAGGYSGNFETATDVGAALLAAEIHGLGEDWVREFPLRIGQTTVAQTKEAAQRLFDPSRAVIVIVGNAAKVAPQLDAAKVKYEVVGYLDPIAKQDRDAVMNAKLVPLDPKKTEAGRKLLEAALAAKGGEDKLRALKSLRGTGKVKLALGGRQFDGNFTRTFLLPDKMRLEIEVTAMKASIIVGIAPAAVWQTVGPQTAQMPPDAAAELRKGLWRDRDLILLRHKDSGTQVQAQPRAGGLDVVLVRDPSGENETRVFLDPKTRDIVRLEYQESGAKGIEEYADYRVVNGVRFAFRQRARGGDQAFDVTLDKIETNLAVDEKIFALPK
jgi:zinc protease